MKFIRSYEVDAFQFLPDDNDSFQFPIWFIEYFEESRKSFEKKFKDALDEGGVYFGPYDCFKINVSISKVRKIKKVTLNFTCFRYPVSTNIGDWVIKKDKRIFRIKDKDFKPPEWCPIKEQ